MFLCELIDYLYRISICIRRCLNKGYTYNKGNRPDKFYGCSSG